VSGTELEEILALVQRVLPDPSGFAERLVQQAVVWWADQSRTGDAAADGAHQLDDDRTIAVTPEPSRVALHESNKLLAAALGACECWGDDRDCGRCAGQGASGWLEPDADLFQLFVGPAVERLSTTFGRDDAVTTTTGRQERRPYATGGMT
jgi:hypothetical protein